LLRITQGGGDNFGHPLGAVRGRASRAREICQSIEPFVIKSLEPTAHGDFSQFQLLRNGRRSLSFASEENDPCAPTSRAAAVRDRANFAIAAFSSPVNSRSLIAIRSLLNRRGFYKRLEGEYGDKRRRHGRRH